MQYKLSKVNSDSEAGATADPDHTTLLLESAAANATAPFYICKLSG